MPSDFNDSVYRKRRRDYFRCALRIRIASPPVDGAANHELIKVLAKRFNVSKSAVEIVAGQTAKTKQIKITGGKSAYLL